jgi:hypothetical protein
MRSRRRWRLKVGSQEPVKMHLVSSRFDGLLMAGDPKGTSTTGILSNSKPSLPPKPLVSSKPPIPPNSSKPKQPESQAPPAVAVHPLLRAVMPKLPPRPPAIPQRPSPPMSTSPTLSVSPALTPTATGDYVVVPLATARRAPPLPPRMVPTAQSSVDASEKAVVDVTVTPAVQEAPVVKIKAPPPPPVKPTNLRSRPSHG